MRKWIAVALVGPMIAGAAVTMSLAQGSKIGFVDTLAVLYATEEGKRELEGLNQFASVKQQEVALLTSEVQDTPGPVCLPAGSSQSHGSRGHGTGYWG